MFRAHRAEPRAARAQHDAVRRVKGPHRARVALVIRLTHAREEAETDVAQLAAIRAATASRRNDVLKWLDYYCVTRGEDDAIILIALS